MTTRSKELQNLHPRIIELIVRYPQLPYSAIATRLGTSERYVSCVAVKAGVRRGKGRK